MEAGVPDRDSNTEGMGHGSWKCVPRVTRIWVHPTGPRHISTGRNPSPWDRCQMDHLT